MHVQEFWDSCAQNKTSEISKKCTSRNSGTPVRRTRRRKSQKMNFQDFLDSCAQNKTSEIPTNGLSGFVGLLCAEQNVINLKKCTFRNSSNQNKLRCLGQNLFGWDAPSGDHVLSQNHLQIHPRGLCWTALGALLLFQTRRKNSLCDLTFSHVFIAIFSPEAKVPSSF